MGKDAEEKFGDESQFILWNWPERASSGKLEILRRDGDKRMKGIFFWAIGEFHFIVDCFDQWWA